jgi:molecular chaperone Hsp33
MFYVMRESGYDIGLYRDPYRGSVPIVSGEIGEDFAYYLLKSEQIPSAVMLGVHLQPEQPYVTAAGGLMIQIMPGADEQTVAAIEFSVSRTPHVTQMIREGASPTDLLRSALGGLELEMLNERPVRFSCTCSYERAVSIISSIDRAELESMLREDHGAVMTCHFCNETYRLDEAELRAVISNG